MNTGINGTMNDMMNNMRLQRMFSEMAWMRGHDKVLAEFRRMDDLKVRWSINTIPMMHVSDYYSNAPREVLKALCGFILDRMEDEEGSDDVYPEIVRKWSISGDFVAFNQETFIRREGIDIRESRKDIGDSLARIREKGVRHFLEGMRFLWAPRDDDPIITLAPTMRVVILGRGLMGEEQGDTRDLVMLCGMAKLLIEMKEIENGTYRGLDGSVTRF